MTFSIFFDKLKRNSGFLIAHPGKILSYLKNRNNIYIVYSMGKVGSSTVYETLRNTIPAKEMFHVHFLTEEYLERKLPGSQHERSINRGKDLLRHLAFHKTKKPKIITIVREPVSQALSNFFENYFDFISEKDLKSTKIPDLIRSYYENQEKLPHFQGFSYPEYWIKHELNVFLDLNILKIEFDHKNQYSIIRSDSFDLLVLKLESMNSNLLRALYEFTGCRFKNMVRANDGTEKEVADIYNNFKDNFRLSTGQLLEIYNSEYSRHFYSAEEREGFLKNWTSDNGSDTGLPETESKL